MSEIANLMLMITYECAIVSLLFWLFGDRVWKKLSGTLGVQKGRR